MAKRFVTSQNLKAHEEAYKATKGTPEYCRYLMANEFKAKGSSKFVHIGYSIPTVFNLDKVNMYIKTIRDKSYIYVEESDGGIERFYIDKEVARFYNV